MGQFLPIYQVTDGKFLYLNVGLISRIKPTDTSSSTDYNIYMNEGFQIRVQREYYQNRIAFEELDSLIQEANRFEDIM